MSIHAIICTRQEDRYCDTPTLKALKTYFYSDVEYSVRVMRGCSSIWEGYSKAFEFIEKNERPDDIVIFCHDDIEIQTRKATLENILENALDDKTGFVGLAGTKQLLNTGIWWGNQGNLSGAVYHGKSWEDCYLTYFGKYGPTEVLDGLFLASRVKTISELNCLSKPDYLDGDWNFYDLHMTKTAINKGLVNKTVPIIVRHESPGEIAGREDWHKARQQFVDHWYQKVIF